jgi:hypothetical protein
MEGIVSLLEYWISKVGVFWGTGKVLGFKKKQKHVVGIPANNAIKKYPSSC